MCEHRFHSQGTFFLNMTSAEEGAAAGKGIHSLYNNLDTESKLLVCVIFWFKHKKEGLCFTIKKIIFAR